jgi:GDP-4-dehydro-6-deoxy-D-mannose reductase
VNVDGTRAVIELAMSLSPPPRVLVISSAHVYAPVSRVQPVVSEDAPLGPTGAYGKTKLQAEEVCRQAAQAGADVIVARAFQHAGPRQLPMFMLPEWAEQFAAADAGPIQVVTLDSFVDLSDVRDVVRAYRLLVRCPRARAVYNVGSGRAVRSGDVFQLLERLTGTQREAVQRAPGLRQHPIADVTHLVRDTQWQPEIPLERTVGDTLADFRARARRPRPA